MVRGRAAILQVVADCARETRTSTGAADACPHIPPGAIFGAGYVPGIARLGVPALKESDASLGVAYVNGLRKEGATALPSGQP